MSNVEVETYRRVGFQDVVGALTLTKDELIFLQDERKREDNAQAGDSAPVTRSWEWDAIEGCVVVYAPQDASVGGKPKRLLQIRLMGSKKKGPSTLSLRVPDSSLKKMMLGIEARLMASHQKKQAMRLKRGGKRSTESSRRGNSPKRAAEADDQLGSQSVRPTTRTRGSSSTKNNAVEELGGHSERPARTRRSGSQTTASSTASDELGSHSERPVRGSRKLKGASTKTNPAEELGRHSERPPRTRRSDSQATASDELGRQSDRPLRGSRKTRGASMKTNPAEELGRHSDRPPRVSTRTKGPKTHTTLPDGLGRHSDRPTAPRASKSIGSEELGSHSERPSMSLFDILAFPARARRAKGGRASLSGKSRLKKVKGVTDLGLASPEEVKGQGGQNLSRSVNTVGLLGTQSERGTKKNLARDVSRVLNAVEHLKSQRGVDTLRKGPATKEPEASSKTETGTSAISTTLSSTAKAEPEVETGNDLLEMSSKPDVSDAKDDTPSTPPRAGIPPVASDALGSQSERPTRTKRASSASLDREELGRHSERPVRARSPRPAGSKQTSFVDLIDELLGNSDPDCDSHSFAESTDHAATVGTDIHSVLGGESVQQLLSEVKPGHEDTARGSFAGSNVDGCDSELIETPAITEMNIQGQGISERAANRGLQHYHSSSDILASSFEGKEIHVPNYVAVEEQRRGMMQGSRQRSSSLPPAKGSTAVAPAAKSILKNKNEPNRKPRRKFPLFRSQEDRSNRLRSSDPAMPNSGATDEDASPISRHPQKKHLLYFLRPPLPRAPSPSDGLGDDKHQRTVKERRPVKTLERKPK